jgi:competence protein ComEC
VRSRSRSGLAGLAVALAAGIALADRAGPLSTAPLLWVAAAVAVAITLRRGRAALCALLLGGALGAHERAGLQTARDALRPWADDRAEETLSGIVEAPVEDDGRAVRFTLVLDSAPVAADAHAGGRGDGEAGGDADGAGPGGGGGRDADGAGPGGSGGRDATPRGAGRGGSGDAAGIRVLVAIHRDPDDEAWTPPLLPGDAIEVTGALRMPRGYLLPGAPRPGRFADARGAAALLTTDWTRVSEPVPGSALDPRRAAALLQRRMARRISDAAGDADRDGVLRALVTGDTSAMSERAAASYRDSGASHVLAVSGLHLAAVALFAFAALRRLWASLPALALRVDPTHAAALGAAPLAVAYTMVTGAPPSAVRALCMILVLLAGVALDRRARLRDAMGAAALLMLAVRPSSLFDPSLQLSFAATGALALFMVRPVDQARPPWPERAWRWLRQLVVASLWTWAATAPVCAFHFGAVALAGPVSNLVAVPAVELVALPLGLGGAVVAELWPAAGEGVLAAAAALTERVTGALANVSAWIPPLPIAPPDLGELAGWCVLLGSLALAVRMVGPIQAMRRRRALMVAAAAAVFLVGSQLWRSELAPRWRDHLRAAFVDVGQGDAAVVEAPGGDVWLIDGGGLPFSLPTRDPATARRLGESPGRDAVARYLALRRIRRIDLAILSHAHPDHFRGLGAIARTVHIEELWLARRHPGAPLGSELERLLAELSARGTVVRSPPAGAVVRRGGATLTVLAPGPSPDDGDRRAALDPVRSENDNSLVVRIDHAGRRLLFTGDLEEEGEEDLVREHGAEGLKADVVKVPHHGSRTSSTQALVDATAPGWAVISCGLANRFGFPHGGVEERWKGSGARVMRTDLGGTITVLIERAGTMRVDSVVGDGGW